MTRARHSSVSGLLDQWAKLTPEELARLVTCAFCGANPGEACERDAYDLEHGIVTHDQRVRLAELVRDDWTFRPRPVPHAEAQDAPLHRAIAALRLASVDPSTWAQAAAAASGTTASEKAKAGKEPKR